MERAGFGLEGGGLHLEGGGCHLEGGSFQLKRGVFHLEGGVFHMERGALHFERGGFHLRGGGFHLEGGGFHLEGGQLSELLHRKRRMTGRAWNFGRSGTCKRFEPTPLLATDECPDALDWTTVNGIKAPATQICAERSPDRSGDGWRFARCCATIGGYYNNHDNIK